MTISWLLCFNEVPDDSNMLTLQRKTVKNFVKSLRYPATKIGGSIKLTQAFCGCSLQHGGLVVGCHTVIIQQSIMAMRLSIGCLWQALRNGTRLKQTSHTLPISSLAPELGTLLQIYVFNLSLTFLYFEKDTFCSSLESCSTKAQNYNIYKNILNLIGVSHIAPQQH